MVEVGGIEPPSKTTNSSSHSQAYLIFCFVPKSAKDTRLAFQPSLAFGIHLLQTG